MEFERPSSGSLLHPRFKEPKNDNQKRWNGNDRRDGHWHADPRVPKSAEGGSLSLPVSTTQGRTSWTAARHAVQLPAQVLPPAARISGTSTVSMAATAPTAPVVSPAPTVAPPGWRRHVPGARRDLAGSAVSSTGMPHGHTLGGVLHGAGTTIGSAHSAAPDGKV